MKIAICGTRGIPACYGGFETFAEELSTRLVDNGYKVVVYGRSHVISYTEKYFRGVEIRLLPSIKNKYLETPIHSFLTFLHLIFYRVDLALVCNAANSPFLWILRLAGIPVVVNVDGIERNRAKWNSLGKLWYLLGEYCSSIFANKVISDAEVIRQYYHETYNIDSTVIPYGYSKISEELLESKTNNLVIELADDKILKRFNLLSGQYLLYVSRLEPENNALVVIKAYNQLPPDVQNKYPLLIVGDAPYADEYKKKLYEIATKNVIFAGFVFGEDYKTLQTAALLYIQATEVGGTHPALVESMGFANCIISNDTPENREVLSDCGLFYLKNNELDLAGKFSSLLNEPYKILEFRRKALSRAQNVYSWDSVTKKYEDLILDFFS
ncbi:MAG: DUF1972 domain-containing protein [Proteobacteria bacterium]|nr:DUF1972 domain-containing protein [Pseudomonadota bacterium]